MGTLLYLTALAYKLINTLLLAVVRVNVVLLDVWLSAFFCVSVVLSSAYSYSIFETLGRFVSIEVFFYSEIEVYKQV